MGKTYSKPSSGHAGGRRQEAWSDAEETLPKDQSACDREERGRGERGGVFDVCMRSVELTREVSSLCTRWKEIMTAMS